MKKLARLAKYIIPAIAVVLIATIVIVKLTRTEYSETEENEELEQEVQLLYGIESDNYNINEGTIEEGETLGAILNRFGVTPQQIDKIAKQSEDVFSVKNMRAGHKYSTFQSKDSTARLNYFVYDIDLTKYLVFNLSNPDSINIYMSEKEVDIERVTKSATISSSLYEAALENDMSPNLAMELADIYAWSIDFFGLQKGDNFKVIYDNKYVDSTNIGNGTIWGAWFEHGGKIYYAIPFIQDGKLSYWDENGNSLRKAFLKAPLKFSRISSRFSNSRLHPVLRIRRPHYGVDYAAPAGTPVHAVADGVVIAKGYAGGGGNTVKIKHNNGKFVSGYLHLRGYAKGLAVGKRVKQGDLIGYVGSTGLSTGPHLDFRLWQNGKPIDPLKVPNEPAEPIKQVNRLAFNAVKDKVMAELKGTLPDSLKITSLEMLAPDSTVSNQTSATK